MEADEQVKRGEKRPPPPPLTPAPTRGKRFDPSSAGNTPLTGHRTLAAAEPLPEDMTGQAKMESPGPGPSNGAPPLAAQPYAARFQVPIAQAPVNQTPSPLGPATSRAITPQHQQMHAQQHPIQHPREQHAVPQLMSPGGHALRPPVASFAYPERDEPPLPLSQSQHQQHVHQQSAKPGQAVRASHMAGPGQGPIPVSTVSSPGLGPASQPPVTEAMSSRAMWAMEAQQAQLSQPSHLGQFPTQPRDTYDRPARMLESQLREAPRHAERAPVRLKQESELVSPYDTPFTPIHQQPQRVVSARPDPAQLMLRQHHNSDPHRTVASGPAPEQQQQHLYGNTSGQQPPAMRQIQGESGINLQPQSQPAERSTLGIKPAPMATSRQDPYAAASTPLIQQAHLDPPPNQPPAARPPQEPRKTSNLFALLNDDPPAAPPPKRVNEVLSGLKPSSTPPPQSMSVRAPPAPPAPVPLRRETEPVGYGSFRNPGGPTSVMPSLKPYNVQSPQEHHSSVQRPTMGSQPNTPAAGPDRGEYYPRHAYTQSQPQQQPMETSPEGPHYLSQLQHGQQQPPVGYQSQSAYPPYGSTGSQQPHSTSPAPLSAHQTPGGQRREPGREPQPQWSQQNQQHLGPAQQQQDRNLQQPQSTGWPTTAPQLKTNQSPSPWGAAHGSNHGDPPSKSSQQSTGQFPSQSSGWRESTQPPQQQQHQPLGFRDDLRGQPVFEAHSQRAPSGMIQHGHHSSLSGRYPATSQVLRRQPEAGLSPQGQPGYGRYPPSQPQPNQRDAQGLPPRSYTPVSMYEPRVPAPPPGAAVQGQPSHRQMHERHAMHEMQFREMQRAEREMLELQQQQQQQQQQGRIHSSGLRGGPGPNEGEVYLSRGQDRSL